jgi:hypothetical protein
MSFNVDVLRINIKSRTDELSVAVFPLYLLLGLIFKTEDGTITFVRKISTLVADYMSTRTRI